MNIGFIVERNVYFKTFGPIIDKALSLGHLVFCLHNYSQSKIGSKGYQFPDISQTPKFKNGNVISLDYKTGDEFIEKCLQNNIQAVVSLDFFARYIPIREKLKDKNVFWVSLQGGFDTGPISGENLSMPDRFFIYSPKWLKWMFEYLKKTGKAQEESFLAFENKLQGKVKPVGFWASDQNSIMNASEIKKKWGIPQEKKVFLLAPFPLGSSLKHFWVRVVYGMDNKFLQLFLNLFSKSNKDRFKEQIKNRENDQQLIKSIKEFCNKNNAFLLVKSRRKDPVKKYLEKIADKVLYDESFYPTTIMECLAISDICLSFYSTSAMEAACLGVPHICVAPAVDDWKDLQNPYFEAIFKEMGDFFDFSGVSWKLSIPDAIKKLKQANFSDFSLNKGQLEKYHQKFIGDLSGDYSTNIIKEIESLK